MILRQVFYLLFLLLSLCHLTSASLDNLRRVQRKCYLNLSPCVMVMNEKRAFGCGQCGEDIRSAPLREFRSLKELILFIDSEDDRRIVMIPEFIFFSTSVVGRLTAKPGNVAAIIVFEGSGDSLNVTDGPTDGPVEPIIVRSDDDTEPNRAYNFYNLTEEQRACDNTDGQTTKQRNPGAVCLKFRFFPFNIFRVNASVADEIRTSAARFPDQNDRRLPGGRNHTSSTAPRYKVDSVGRMFACPSEEPKTPNEEASEDSATETELFVTSEQCLRDKTCLPIGGHSLWSSLSHLDKRSNDTVNILAITAPMDSIAFFNDFSRGASGEISSLAVMMAVADAVGKYRRGPGAEDPILRYPVYFAWNAQSWGYAGSSRFLKDIQEFECEEEADVSEFAAGCVKPYMPSLKFLDFKEAEFSVLNIGQMISPNRTDVPIEFEFFTHGRDPATVDNIGDVEQAVRTAFESHPDFGETGLLEGDEGSYTRYVPIDASQSFHRYLPETDMITVANYKKSFTNKLYHTTFDIESKTRRPEDFRKPMYSAAEAIAASVVSLAFDKRVSVSINRTIIDDAVICLTGNWSRCELGREYLGDFFNSRAGSVIPGNYPGSFFPLTRLSDRNPSAAAKLNLLRSFFAFHNRYEVPEEEVSCNTLQDCDDFRARINTRVSPQSQSELRSVFCTRGVCVASDTYTHNAFGTALNATNDAQSSFLYDSTKLKDTFNGSDPQEAGWTESVWDSDIGLCTFVEDTKLYGGLILLAGLIVMVLSGLLGLWLDRLMFEKQREIPVETEPTVLQATSV